MEQEKRLVQMEDELFDLAGQIVVLTLTTLHSLEEEQMLANLQEQEEQLMIKAEKLQKKIAEVWQGISIPEIPPQEFQVGVHWKGRTVPDLRQGEGIIHNAKPTHGNCLNY